MKELYEMAKITWDHNSITTFNSNNRPAAKDILKRAHKDEVIEALMAKNAFEKSTLYSLKETEKELMIAIYVLLRPNNKGIFSREGSRLIEEKTGKTIDVLIPDDSRVTYRENVKGTLIDDERRSAIKKARYAQKPKPEREEREEKEPIRIKIKKDEIERKEPEEEKPEKEEEPESIDDTGDDYYSYEPEEEEERPRTYSGKERPTGVLTRPTSKTADPDKSNAAKEEIERLKRDAVEQLERERRGARNPKAYLNSSSKIEKLANSYSKRIEDSLKGRGGNPSMVATLVIGRMKRDIAIAINDARKANVPTFGEKFMAGMRDTGKGIARATSTVSKAVADSAPARGVRLLTMTKIDGARMKTIGDQLGPEAVTQYEKSKTREEREAIYKQALDARNAERAVTPSKRQVKEAKKQSAANSELVRVNLGNEAWKKYYFSSEKEKAEILKQAKEKAAEERFKQASSKGVKTKRATGGRSKTALVTDSTIDRMKALREDLENDKANSKERKSTPISEILRDKIKENKEGRVS